ncbi:DUF726-domain-containing protein [Atractiella rhizophila]|nr:DUF726-domain-containing protein [Atractiella rhizophila]
MHLGRAEQQVSQSLYFSMEEARKKEEDKEAAGKTGWLNGVMEAKKKAEGKNKLLKWGMTGAGFIVGGVALGLTGGLAAPAVIPILSGLGIGIFAGAGGVVGLGFLFGLAGGGLAAYRTEKRFQAIEEFGFEKIGEKEEKEEGLPDIPALDVTICCAGFLVNPEEYISIFAPMYSSPHVDAYAVKCETEAYLNAGKKLDHYVRNYLIKVGTIEVLKRTALAAVLGAVALPMTVYKTASMTLDNDFQRTRDKAAKAGVLLADVLSKRVQGGRPVTLVGSSLGAITVFNCLLELRKMGLHDLVYDAILISAPLSPSYTEWELARSVVAHNVYNVWSDEDFVLAIVARLHSLVSTKMTYKVAGLQATDAKGIVNVDISDILGGHLELAAKMSAILERVKDVDEGKEITIKKKSKEERERDLKEAEAKEGKLVDSE